MKFWTQCYMGVNKMPTGIPKKGRNNGWFKKGNKINLGRKREDMVRDKHWNWKGGRNINTQGYILIHRPDHPRSNNLNYVLEHILVMENMIRRCLSPEEIVHHIDGDKQNNKEKNLHLFENKSEHTTYHISLKEYVKQMLREVKQ